MRKSFVSTIRASVGRPCVRWVRLPLDFGQGYLYLPASQAASVLAEEAGRHSSHNELAGPLAFDI